MPARSLSVLGISEIDAIGRVRVFDAVTVITAVQYVLCDQIGFRALPGSTVPAESANHAGKSQDDPGTCISYPLLPG